MAKFKILESKILVNSVRSDGRCALKVELLEGVPQAGDQFQLWETHHKIDYTVVDVEISESDSIVLVAPSLAWPGWNTGTVVDTKNPKESFRHGFGGAGKFLYHPDALKAEGVGEDGSPIDG